MIIDRLKRLTSTVRPTCYLHIGPEKTGTTSIQHVLRATRSALRKAGLDLPELVAAGGKRRKNHCYLARAQALNRIDGAPLESAPDWSALSSHMKGGRRSVVISGETLANRMLLKPDYDEIVGFFVAQGYRIVLIVYVRDQPLWLNSCFVQAQKALRWRSTFDDYVAHALQHGCADPWDHVRHALDDDRVELEVVSFEQAVARGLEQDFLNRIGASAVTAPAIEIPNPNIGVKGVFAAQEIIRRAGPLASERPLRGWISKRLRKMSAERGWSRSPFMGFDQAGYDAHRERCRASSDRHAQTFFGTDWADVCPPRTVVRNVFEPAAASAADRAEVDGVVETLVRLARERRDAPRAADEKQDDADEA